MKPIYKGIILAVLQLALVSSLGVKLLHDRATRPRVWVRTFNYDPDLPIRGRYLSLSVLVKMENFSAEELQHLNEHVYIGSPGETPEVFIQLEVKDNELVAEPSRGDKGIRLDSRFRRPFIGPPEAKPRDFVLEEPLYFYLPEHATGPVGWRKGEELWAEVTIPRNGPPRPIRLGTKKNGVLTPLPLD